MASTRVVAPWDGHGYAAALAATFDTSFRPAVPRSGPKPLLAGDLREWHRSVFVERAIGRLGDAEGRDTVLGRAWAG